MNMISYLCKKGMATVIIKNTSKAAKQMLEYLKTQPYATVIEEEKPNAVTLQAIEEARNGKTIKCENFEEYLDKVK
jgi:antitoxin component of RelBE/YafQ-DinJ toxin-antitoxin module